MPYKVALVDDRPQNLRSLSERLIYSGMAEITFTARNGQEYLERLMKLPPADHPEVTLMDIDMPVLDGIQTVKQACMIYPATRYIMLTVFDDDDKLFDAIKAGASGYLLKEESVEAIIVAIREVLEQAGAPMSPRIARKALQLLRLPPADNPETTAQDDDNTLSAREKDVLQELVNGLDYREIGIKLFISPHTVRKHIANIYTKLHVTSKSQAVKLALKNRWGS
ncbi:MAG: response regulator transcription factor [Sphingobacteriales bacterium]|nr:MAG: response regulator transcription factor [Sphingobacteriales bacterium]